MNIEHSWYCNFSIVFGLEINSIKFNITNLVVLFYRGVRKEWATSGERADVVRHVDNLHPEGEFVIPETQVEY